MTQYSGSSANAVTKNMRVSPRKLNLVASFIRNMKASEALVQLTFSKKRIAGQVKKCLQSAIANAENNFGLDIDKLVVSSATVGKSVVMKRVMPRARGRSARINKFLSNLYITLTEMVEE
ncbi:MAG: 50S ribosomal protein L22 [Rickettsiaceae bacterium]|nr:50S ribosomal protein L22 [Rickettsiaceae bacterium]